MQRRSSFNAEGVKWRQSWSSCEEEEYKEGEGDGKREGKKMYLEKLKKKSVNVFRSIEDEMTSNSGRAEELEMK